APHLDEHDTTGDTDNRSEQRNTEAAQQGVELIRASAQLHQRGRKARKGKYEPKVVEVVTKPVGAKLSLKKTISDVAVEEHEANGPHGDVVRIDSIYLGGEHG